MSAAFTPGPWESDGGRIKADGLRIADLWLGDENWPENSDLIAAAPELYEALCECRMALIAIEDSAVEAGFDRLGDIIGERLTKANLAIDKADGAR